MFTLLKILALLAIVIVPLLKPKRKISKQHPPVSGFVVDDKGDIKTDDSELNTHKRSSQ